MNDIMRLRNITKRLFSLILVSLLCVILFTLGACKKKNDNNFLYLKPELYESIIMSQEAYLKSLQLPCGAFVKWSADSTENVVVPYFACFAAYALLEDEKNAECVKKYIDWHFSALNKEEEAIEKLNRKL